MGDEGEKSDVHVMKSAEKRRGKPKLRATKTKASTRAVEGKTPATTARLEGRREEKLVTS